MESKRQEIEERPVWVFGDIEGKLKALENSWEKLQPKATEVGMGKLIDAEAHDIVFIGDVLDKGADNFRTISFLGNALLNDGNVFIVGNRDVNKLRLRFELCGLGSPCVKALDMSVESDYTFRVPGWKADWEDFLTRSTTGYGNGALKSDLATKARFLFEKTMGCPKLLEFLVEETGREDALNTFLGELHPVNGDFTNLLWKGRIMVQKGSTLYVHGGITDANYLWVPPKRKWEDWHKAASFAEWKTELHDWYTGCLDAYRVGNLEGVIPLLEYQEPPVVEGKWDTKRANSRSVIHARVFNDDMKVVFPSDELIKDLLQNGVKRIVHGHSPVGDVALYRRHPNLDFEIVSADTSASSATPSAIEISEDRVRILGECQGEIVYCDSKDPKCGVEKDGKFCIREGLHVRFEPHPAGFVVPKYEKDVF